MHGFRNERNRTIYSLGTNYKSCSNSSSLAFLHFAILSDPRFNGMMLVKGDEMREELRRIFIDSGELVIDTA